MAKTIYEYRGVCDLVYAEVTKDDATGYVTGTVKPLAGVAEIAKTSTGSSEAHWYDNIPACVVTSQGNDTVTITTSAIPLDVLADITGQVWDEDTGTYIEGEKVAKMFAIGYKTQATNGDEYYVWRLKGSFTSPDQTNSTLNDSTDANGQELTYTGISTTYKFQKNNKPAMAVTVNTALDRIANKAQFFNTVQTPDTIVPGSVVPEVVLDRSNISVEVGETLQLNAITKPVGETVTWSMSSGSTYASVANGLVTGLAEGSATVTASITVGGVTYTDTCAVTVTAASA